MTSSVQPAERYAIALQRVVGMRYSRSARRKKRKHQDIENLIGENQLGWVLRISVLLCVHLCFAGVTHSETFAAAANADMEGDLHWASLQQYLQEPTEPLRHEVRVCVCVYRVCVCVCMCV